jgi:hypothetical protein
MKNRGVWYTQLGPLLPPVILKIPDKYQIWVIDNIPNYSSSKPISIRGAAVTLPE